MAPGVVQQMERATRQVGAALRQCAVQHHGIGGQLVAGREHIEKLPGREGHHVFVVLVHTPDTMRCGGPPLLGEHKGLVHEVERPLLPRGVGKTPVLGRGRHGMAGFFVRAGSHSCLGIGGQFLPLAQRQVRQVHALAW